jgi:hypothetical protein
MVLFYTGDSMSKVKNLNVSELINEYDEDFINSISLNNISNCKELKELLVKLEKANYTVTSFYEMLFNDYVMVINSDNEIPPSGFDIDTLKKYKSLASRIQKAYSYILYISTFENPFKISKRK